jgi:hypothetical protein
MVLFDELRAMYRVIHFAILLQFTLDRDGGVQFCHQQPDPDGDTRRVFALLLIGQDIAIMCGNDRFP